jgi:hypothetical protein
MSAKNFKVGDKVKVRRDLIIGKFYGNVRCNNSMERMVGKVFTIRNVDEQYYKVTENEWNWSDGMLEPVEKTLDDLCAGDFIKSGSGIRKILAAVDGCYLLSYIGEYTATGAWCTVDELKEAGYSFIELDTPEPTIEIGGKKYKKAEVEKVIKDLEPIE